MATCDAPPASLSNEEFLSLMHNKLPPYVVKCLLAAGFDVVEVVASMDISEKPGNTIEVIEKFINQHFSDNDEYTMSLKPFVFPPGHRMRLGNFVSEVRASRHVIATKKNNVRLLATRFSRQQATIDTSDSDGTQGDSSISVDHASSHISRLTAKWVQKQSIPFNTLKENEHFVVKVTHVAKSRLSAFIECCACKSNIKLQTRTQSIRIPSYLISNWTRHAKRCSFLASKLSSGKSLLDLLSPPSSSSGETTKISNASVNESDSERSEFVRSDEPPADVAIFFSVTENNDHDFVSAAVEPTGFDLTDENMSQEASSGIQQENM